MVFTVCTFIMYKSNHTYTNLFVKNETIIFTLTYHDPSSLSSLHMCEDQHSIYLCVFTLRKQFILPGTPPDMHPPTHRAFWQNRLLSVCLYQSMVWLRFLLHFFYSLLWPLLMPTALLPMQHKYCKNPLWILYTFESVLITQNNTEIISFKIIYLSAKLM